MHCKSCGNNHQENYCPACGEKAFNPKQLSVNHFIEDSFESFIHFDTKFFRTIKTLISKPGQLSVDYVEGRRIKYMKPIQLFLVVNLIYFIIMIANANIYGISLYNYINYKPFTNYNTAQLVNEKLALTKLSLAEYTQLFNERIVSDSKELIFLFVLVYAIIFGIFLFWKRKYLVEHLIFATHFMTIVLIISIVANYCIRVPFYLITRVDYSVNFDNILSSCISLSIAIYTSIAIRKFYRANIAWGIFVSLFIGVTFFFFIQYYRMLLFYKILYLG
jgi:hypothetical protein